ncbi:hypothetical protein GCM10027200_36680 [Lentzea nigeriaca]
MRPGYPTHGFRPLTDVRTRDQPTSAFTAETSRTRIAVTESVWWQIETAKTIVFTAPRHARAFFESLAADNLDIGRPDTMEII